MSRGRSRTRSARTSRRNDIKCIGSASTASTDSIPRSHSPTSRTSRYVQDRYSASLATFLNPEGKDRCPGVRCNVLSLPYKNTKLGSSGLYSGEIGVVSKLPDGEGTLVCHNRRVYEGEWRLGGLLPCSDYSAETCDSSTCSSLSASVTRLRARSGGDDTKVEVPKNLYIISRSPSNVFPEEDANLVGRRSSVSRVELEESVSEQTAETEDSTHVNTEYSSSSIDSKHNGKRASRKLFVSTVISTIFRRS